MVYDVPYFSQWESPDLVPALLSGELRAEQDPLWARSGARSPEEYAFWSWRACGVACLRMLLTWWTGSAPAALPLVRECREVGAYVVTGERVQGLIYSPFCGYLEERWGLDARVVTDTDTADVASLVTKNRLAVVSVHPSIRQPTSVPPERGGHLVLVVGTEHNSIVIHNPSGLPGSSQQFARLDFATFDRYFARRGVIIERH
ncbi:C39 family peptidase [Streptomyces canus]|uniref:C39 family peptidase n=1 Tax=Streptomyces canus TaxID=58343 RepID=UPI002E2F3A79|nr:C39 family peptidase [Streptomyces canus]